MLRLLAQLAVAFVAFTHTGFLILEMFFWDHPVGEQVFGLPRDVLRSSAALAANQGLYNGFLAAGLVWGLVARRADVQLFFLGCVVVAGVFGGATAGAGIAFVQALPAAVALALVLATKRLPSPPR